uniref:Uncharacterized protein n=1 Tax=Mycena chlorophos TaxID=658473 RepID=A0ABQ0LAP1_MYCCL|nr:predicted protein [Mycena chlorophos]
MIPWSLAPTSKRQATFDVRNTVSQKRQRRQEFQRAHERPPSPEEPEDEHGTPIIIPASAPARTHNRRNVALEISRRYHTTEALERAIARFNIRHLRHLVPSAIKARQRAERLWLSFFTALFRNDATKAANTLLPNHDLPDPELIKMYFITAATNGKSHLGIPGITGWTYRTTRQFMSTTFDMSLKTFVVKFKGLTTKRRAKKFLTEADLDEAATKILSPELGVRSRFMRLQLLALLVLIYTQGTRIGSIVVSQGHSSDQCLKWGHLEIVVYPPTATVGPLIHIFMKIHYNKGQRYYTNLFIQTNLYSLPVEKIAFDFTLILAALGHLADAFVEDLLDLLEHPENVQAPYSKIAIWPEMHDIPVFVDAKDRKKAMTYSQAAGSLRYLANHLDWEGKLHLLSRFTHSQNADFRWLSLRYGYASTMVVGIPKQHLVYLMGHNNNTDTAETVYQTDDRRIDLAGARHEGTQNHDLADLAHRQSSVAWNRKTVEDYNVLRADPTLKRMVADLQILQQGVQAAYGASVDDILAGRVDITDHDTTSDASRQLDEALDLAVEIFNHYLQLSAGHRDSTNGKRIPTEPVHRAHIVQSVLEFMERPTSNPLTLIGQTQPNPRAAVALWLTTFVLSVDSSLKNACFWCITYGEAGDEVADHGRDYATHAYTCELTHHPNEWRCDVCQTLHPYPAPLSAYTPHQTSFPTLTNSLILPLDAEQPDEVSRRASYDNCQDHAQDCLNTLTSAKPGVPLTSRLFFSLGLSQLSGRNLLVYFCPVCVANTKLSLHFRLRSFPGLTAFHRHLLTHWTHSILTIFPCNIAPCSPTDDPMPEPLYIQHLQTVHGYALVRCNRGCTQHTDPTCTQLPPNPHFHEDARYAADASLGTAATPNLPPVTLVDHRRADDRIAAQDAAFCRALAVDPSIQRVEFPKESIPPPLRKEAHPKISRSGPILPNPGVFRVQRCLREILPHATIYGRTVVNNILAECPKPSALLRCPIQLLKDAEFVTDHTSFLAFQRDVKAWRQANDLPACLTYLSYTFPDLQTAHVAEAAAACDYDLESLLEATVQDMQELGMQVEPDQWPDVLKEMQEWYEECG